MNFAIRVDASTAIGLGHVKRCLSLASAIRTLGSDVTFVARDLGLPVARYVEAEGFRCVTLPTVAAPAIEPSVGHAHWARVDWRTDAAQTIEALTGVGPCWLVVDHYSFDAQWHRVVARGLGCRIAAIDDLGDRDLAADAVIDHNHAASHRAKYADRVAPGVPILGGPTYALLGPAYAQAPRYEFNPRVRSIGIFMGGVDRDGFSALALQACRAVAGFERDVEIVTTPANPHLPALDRAVADSRATSIALDLPDLAGFFARHDLQVGAGGGATWERCCIGAPTLAIIVADNQRLVLQPLAELGVLSTAEVVPPDEQALGHALRALVGDPALRRDLATRSRALVDGHGARRVAEHLVLACNP